MTTIIYSESFFTPLPPFFGVNNISLTGIKKSDKNKLFLSDSNKKRKMIVSLKWLLSVTHLR